MTRFALHISLVLAGSLALTFGISELRSARATNLVADAGIGASPIPAPPPEAVGSGSARPSAEISDPVTDPVGAIKDVQDAGRRDGWALGLLVGFVAVSLGLRTAARKWPTSRALRWMSGRPGLVVIGVGVVGSAAFDAFVFGGSWLAAGYAGLGALLAMVAPEPKKTEAV